MMTNTTAWMLRQDGAAFGVPIHLYADGDSELDSEAECAAFIVSTQSKDAELAYQVLDAWMALQLIDYASYKDIDAEAICDRIRVMLSDLPYHFSYPLSVDKLLSIHNSCSNYANIDELYEYVDSLDVADLQQRIRDSINQQFCRVRYGGKYNTRVGNSCLWFRISSVGFNWANTIYLFVSDMYRKLQVDTVSICRDYESDYGDRLDMDEYFYKAKDGTAYYMMPIDEYLAEEHEHSPVFSACSISEGVYAFIHSSLESGSTFEYIRSVLDSNDIKVPHHRLYNVSTEISKHCIRSAELLDSDHTVTRRKFSRVINRINEIFPDVHISSIDERPRANRNGNDTGCELVFKLISKIPSLNELELGITSTKPVSTLTPDIIVRKFRKELSDYCQFRNIDIRVNY